MSHSKRPRLSASDTRECSTNDHIRPRVAPWWMTGPCSTAPRWWWDCSRPPPWKRWLPCPSPDLPVRVNSMILRGHKYYSIARPSKVMKSRVLRWCMSGESLSDNYPTSSSNHHYIFTLPVPNHIIPGKLDQYHDHWRPGSCPRQDIRFHSIQYSKPRIRRCPYLPPDSPRVLAYWSDIFTDAPTL